MEYEISGKITLDVVFDIEAENYQDAINKAIEQLKDYYHLNVIDAYHNKDDGLIPYKYTFNCENFELTGYFTEKIIDAILSETLIFYHGCPDIYAYIDKRAFVWLDLSNFESDYNYIKKCINEKLWEQRLPYIREAKKKILSDLQFFPRIKKIIDRVEIHK